MGRHRHRAQRAARTLSSRSLAVTGLLVGGFVLAPLFSPAPAGTIRTEPQRLSSPSTSLHPASRVAAAVLPHVLSTSPTSPTILTKTANPNSATASTAAKPSTTDLPRHSGTDRRIVYAITAQRVWVVGRAGNVQSSYLVSGRLTQPLPGRYHVYSKARWTVSSVSAETMQYMVRFAHGSRTGSPIGFHSIPHDYAGHPAQSVDDLGKPLSAGCIRQRMRDAILLWDFAHIGTRVVVLP